MKIQNEVQMGKQLKVTLNQKEIEAARIKLQASFPYRALKFFAGFILFIPITAISFGIHCFRTNEWPWSECI